MSARRWVWLVVAATLMGSGGLAAQERPAPVPVTGSELEVSLSDGSKLKGELIETMTGSLVLRTGDGFRDVDFDAITEIQARRHRLDRGKTLGWVAIGALVTGAGMTYACSQVEDTDCGGVFPAMVLSWAVIGVPLAIGLSGSSWESVPTQDEALRPRARFPQGAPADFRSRRSPPG